MPEGITLTCKVKNRIPSNISRRATTYSRPSESAVSAELKQLRLPETNNTKGNENG